MTIDLQRLIELEAAATPGPWGECCESSEWYISPIDKDGNYNGYVMSSDTDSIDQADADLIVALRNGAQNLIAAARPVEWLPVKEDSLPEDGAEYPFLGFDGSIVIGFLGFDEQDGTEYLSIRNPGGRRRHHDPYNYERWLPIAVPLSPEDLAMNAEAAQQESAP